MFEAKSGPAGAEGRSGLPATYGLCSGAEGAKTDTIYTELNTY